MKCILLEAESPAECHPGFPVLAGDAYKVIQKRFWVKLEEGVRKQKNLFGSQGPVLCGDADHESFPGTPSKFLGHNVCEVTSTIGLFR